VQLLCEEAGQPTLAASAVDYCERQYDRVSRRQCIVDRDVAILKAGTDEIVLRKLADFVK
jgi:hypothetical protein